MQHQFNVEIAVEYGIHSAIILEHLSFWIAKNEADGINYYDGKYWTFTSRKACLQLFPYMSDRQINTAFEKLLEAGIIEKGNYNKNPMDRTLWYALTEKGKCILRFDQMQGSKNEKCILRFDQMQGSKNEKCILHFDQMQNIKTANEVHSTSIIDCTKDISIEDIKEKTPKGVKEKARKMSLEETEAMIAAEGLPAVAEEALKDWIGYKRSDHGFSYTERGLNSLLGILKKNIAVYGAEAVAEIIGISISRQWQGICWEKITKRENMKTFAHEDEAYRAAQMLSQKVHERLPSLSPQTERELQKWANVFNACHVDDGLSWKDIGEVLLFSQNDEFWRVNIIDADSFRKKYVRLLAEMQRNIPPASSEKITKPDKTNPAEYVEYPFGSGRMIPRKQANKEISASELVEYPLDSGNWMPPWEADRLRKGE